MVNKSAAKISVLAALFLVVVACAAPVAQAPATAVAKPVVKTEVAPTEAPADQAGAPTALVATMAAVVAPAAELWAAAGPPAIAADFSPTSPDSVQLAAGVPQLVEVYAYF